MRYPCYFRKKRKSLNFLNSNSNFASIHVDFSKKVKTSKIFKFEFKLRRIEDYETKKYRDRLRVRVFSKPEAQGEGDALEAEAVENDT